MLTFPERGSTGERIVMPASDQPALLPTDTEPERSARSRRSVLRGVAGAAGVAAVAMTGGALPAAARALAHPSRDRVTARPGAFDPVTARAADSDAAADLGDFEPVVVHVRDAASGEMDVFRGTTHTRVRDTELAMRLIRASR
jgi:hypothetical protein